MEELPSVPRPASTKTFKFKFSLIVLIALLFAFSSVVAFYFGVTLQKRGTFMPPSTVVEVVKKAEIGSTGISSDDIKKLRSDIIVSTSKPQYAVFLKLRDKDAPSDYYPFGSERGSLFIYDDLVTINLESGERKVYELSQNIIPTQMVEYLKDLPSEGGSHYRLNAELLRWSPFSDNTFWIKLKIYSNGDPPIANQVGFIKMDLRNSTIEKYSLPVHGLFGKINENTNAEKVLYESVGDGLFLYVFDLKTKDDQLVQSYKKDVFDTHCSGVIEYVYDSAFYGDCGRDRGLRADWDGKNVYYYDFITQKRVDFIFD